MPSDPTCCETSRPEADLSSLNERTLLIGLFPLFPFPIPSTTLLLPPPESDVRPKTTPRHRGDPSNDQTGHLQRPLHGPRLWYAPYPYYSLLVRLFYTRLFIHLTRHLGIFFAVYCVSIRILL